MIVVVFAAAGVLGVFGGRASSVGRTRSGGLHASRPTTQLVARAGSRARVLSRADNAHIIFGLSRLLPPASQFDGGMTIWPKGTVERLLIERTKYADVVSKCARLETAATAHITSHERP